jgi:CsoR family transcriptional regulator, copper-sensing transcriptional repressor
MKQLSAKCCGASAELHPDHTKEMHRINRVAGQVQGVRRMIEEREYCPKIIIQIQAIRAALKALESAVLEKHLHTCVQETLYSRDPKEAEKKMSELMELFGKK